MTKISQKQVKNNSHLNVTSSVRKTFKSVTNDTDINVSCNTYSPVTFKFKSRRKNPDWSPASLIPLRSCHIRNKAEILEPDVFISRTPKWLTLLEKEDADKETGEIFYSDYETDDFKSARNRKIKTVEKFCNYYEWLYHTRKVSLLFHTFTRINYAKQDMKRMMDNVKYRYKSLGKEIRGFIWVLEISPTNHVHYHLIVAIDRVKWKTIPQELKFEDLWGQRTGVEFIVKSVKSYLTKYLYKSEARLLQKRSYAISRKLI